MCRTLICYKNLVDVCVSACVCVYKERKRSVLTAQSNDVAAVFMDKFLSHSFLHNLLHLRMKESE